MNPRFRIALATMAMPAILLAQEPQQAASPAPAPPPTAPAPAGAPGGSSAKPYTVTDDNKVDPNTYAGWQTWRAMACERCHGANQEGLVGPSLINSLKRLTKQEFVFTVTHGRPDKGMPNFGEVPTVVKNIDNLYAYLKGRSDGAIKPGHVYKMQP